MQKSELTFFQGHDEDAIVLMSQYTNMNSDMLSTGYIHDIHTMLNKHVS